MTDLKEDAKRIEQTLRLRTYITGLEFIEKAEDLKKIEKVRKPETRRVFCQVVTMARTYGWTIGMNREDFVRNSFCPAMLGLSERREFMRDGSYKGAVWFETKEDARRYEDQVPVIPAGKFEAVVIGPMSRAGIDPQISLIYGNPAQMMLVVNALQWKDYERMTFYCSGESSCADAIAQCCLSKKPSLSIPCYGERRFGHAQDDELVIAVPSESLAKICHGLDSLWKKGIRYPIPYFGVQVDPNEGMPDIFKHYHSLE